MTTKIDEAIDRVSEMATEVERLDQQLKVAAAWLKLLDDDTRLSIFPELKLLSITEYLDGLDPHAVVQARLAPEFKRAAVTVRAMWSAALDSISAQVAVQRKLVADLGGSIEKLLARFPRGVGASIYRGVDIHRGAR